MKRGFDVPVNGMSVIELPRRMKRAIKAAQKELPPNTGVIVFAFDFGAGGGMAYAANAERDDCIAALQEWIAKQRGERN